MRTSKVEHACIWCGFTSKGALRKWDDRWICKSGTACVRRIRKKDGKARGTALAAFAKGDRNV